MLRPLATLAFLLALTAPPAAAKGAAFPEGFLWGAATAAHQVEGRTVDDWVAHEAKPGFVKTGETSAIGVGHYERFREDFDLAQGMGHNTHRLSIDWARIEPRKGVIDWDAVDHYHDVFRALQARGMQPMVTLHHFTNPNWVAAQGAFLNPATVADFGRFAAFCGREFGREVDCWITVNEPNVYAFNAYDAGEWPPRHQDREEALQVMAALVRAHAAAYHALHVSDHGDADGDGKAACVGVAQHIALFDPLDAWRPLDGLTAHFNDAVFNRAGLNGITTGRLKFSIPGSRGVDGFAPEARSACDFIGVNYYTRWRCDPGHVASPKDRLATPGSTQTGMGWEDYPEGLYRALKLANEYTHLPDGRRIPIIVTENGIDDRQGSARASYLVRHVDQVARAIGDGIDVRGYVHWTLMDNFEWIDGYAPRFGLYAIDRRPGKRLARVATPGVAAFKAIAAANGIPDDLAKAYLKPSSL